MSGRHPRDAFITIYGRKPVLEALRHPGVEIARLLVARNVEGETVDRILMAGREHGINVERVEPAEVTRLSRNAKQDQGVVADVAAPRMDALNRALEAGEVRGPLFALDGVTTPGNVGLILRTAVAAGMGVVLPRAGCPEVGPMVVKASAGVAFSARILRTREVATGLDALRGAGYRVVALAADAEVSLWDAKLRPTDVYLLGGETHGVSEAARAHVDMTIAIPMDPAAESLNVAVAAGVVAFEVRRRLGRS